MSASLSQPGVLRAVPMLARHLVFDARPAADARAALARLRDAAPVESVVVGIGQPLALALGATLDGLRPFPALAGPGCAFPSTQAALWMVISSGDSTELHDRARAIRAALGEGFELREEVACFRYREGRDLSGYVDGTENPKDDRAIEAAIVAGRGEGLDGSSFVAVQRWVHDLRVLAALSSEARDLTIGRRVATDEEIADAPPRAHVKRTAQESFDPPAFMVRRSMPWGGVDEHGLYFVAYGRSLDAFEAALRRMAGLEDGIVDALLDFSRAVTGGYYWCPPVRAGLVDLRALGL